MLKPVPLNAAANVDVQSGADAFPSLGDVVRVHPPLSARSAVIFTSPHAGQVYPPDLVDASSVGVEVLRRSEDAYVTELIATAPLFGIALVEALVARAYVDVNRDAAELDPQMFEDAPAPFPALASARVNAGLGAIARVAGDGVEIYKKKLTWADAQRRIEAVHTPYHVALRECIALAKTHHAQVVLVDWHSMPSGWRGCGRSAPLADVVLGDRFGISCHPGVTRLIEQAFAARGFAVTRNMPYAGGYTTHHYGRPEMGVHAIQIEINRNLYMDEGTLSRSRAFATAKAVVGEVIEKIAAADWAARIG